MSDHSADYDKHTDEELDDAIKKAERDDEYIAEQGSSEALEAERQQRKQMEAELADRED